MLDRLLPAGFRLENKAMLAIKEVIYRNNKVIFLKYKSALNIQ